MWRPAKYLYFGLVKFILILSLMLLNITLVIGNNHTVDSLLNQLKQTEEDSLKVDLFLDISWAYHNSKPDQTILYAHRAYELSKVIDYKKGQTTGLNLIGVGYDVQGDLDVAMNYYQSAINLAKEVGDEKVVRNYLNNVGLVYERQGNYKKAMECYHNALAMVDEEKEKELASILLNNIGIIHSGEERYEKALKYFERSLSIERSLNNPLGISMALSNIGEQQKKLGKKTKALICYKEALAISEKIGDRVGEALLLSNIGELHVENGLLDLAEELYPKALNLARDIGDKGTIALVLNNIAKLKHNKEKYQSAIKYAQEALSIARHMGDKKMISEIFETLTNNYVASQDFAKAYEYQTMFNQAKDSLISTEKSRQILEIATQYETHRKETENQLLKEQQGKNEAIIKQRTTIVFAIAITLILMSIIAFILYKNNRQKNRYSLRLEDEVANRTSDLEETNTKLRGSNKELERFAYIASHDLKEPLRNIMSFTKLVERRLPEEVKADKDINEYLTYISNNTKQMHRLIEDVLEFSRIDQAKIENEIIEVKDVMTSVVNVLNSTLKEKNVNVNIGNLPKVKVSSSQLFLVLKNLVENGIKYNLSDHPVISVFSVIENGMHKISVVDNGIGIEEQYYKRVFSMFKRLHNREEYQGSGLGLSICKKIVESMNGTISVESTEGIGSKFWFTLPIVETQNSDKKNTETQKRVTQELTT